MRNHPWSRTLWQVQRDLQHQNPDLHGLYLRAQAHYGCDGLAFIHVYGCDEDPQRGRALCDQAAALLRAAGCAVQLHESKDVYYVTPQA